MPLPYHLIDGYNLLHAAGLARASYGPGDLERARVGLLVRLADGLDDAERERTTVVFDAADPPPDADRRFRFREMTVLFAVEEGEADALIEELIRKHPSPRQLRVVSDDRRLQQAAKRRGSQAVKSEAFLGRLRRSAGPAARPKGGPSEPPPGTAADWADFFGLSGDELATPLESARPEPVESTERSPDRPGRQAMSGHTAGPQTPGSDPAASPAPRQGAKAAKLASEADAEPPAEDVSFWQRRIDELLSGGGERPG